MVKYYYMCERKEQKKDSPSTNNNLKSSKSIFRTFNSPFLLKGENENVNPPLHNIEKSLNRADSHERNSTLIGLQETHGNQYAQKVAAGIQTKLKINEPGDIYEQEADRVAKQVMRMPEPKVQRKCPGDKNCPLEDEKKKGFVQLKTDQTFSGENFAPDNLIGLWSRGLGLILDMCEYIRLQMQRSQQN